MCDAPLATPMQSHRTLWRERFSQVLADNIISFCRQRSFQPVAVERTSQRVMMQELVSLSHGISMIPAMAQQLDHSDRRVYRSLAGQKLTRTVAVIWNPYRFQSRLIKVFRERLRPARTPPACWSSLHEKSTNVGWRCPGSVRAFSLSLGVQLTLTEVRHAD